MKLIMSGGGTGGHVNPAIAIADYIKSREPDSQITFVGTPHGIENKLVPAAGYELAHIDVSGLKRSLSLKNIRTAWLALTSVPKAKRLLRSLKPELVMGTGGYACWPIVRAAVELGIPTALHESNAIPGMAVKMLESGVDRVYVNFEATIPRLKFPEKALRVGNPLRGAFGAGAISREDARRRLGLDGRCRAMLLSCGGSMGAERVNEEVIKLMRDFSSKHPEIYHVHATGAIEYKAAREMFEREGLDAFPNLECVEYIYDMPVKMAAADIVINRAGAITLSEMATLGKPCVLIPSPNVTDNHQVKNASALAEIGAAVMLEESALNGSTLTDTIAALIGDRERLAKMSEAIRGTAVKDAAKLIYEDLYKTVLK